MLPYYFLSNVEWLALAIFTAATTNWLMKGPGAKYTAAWWALALLLGILALARVVRLGE